MIIKNLLSFGVKKLREANIDSANLDASILLAHIMGTSRELLLMNNNQLVHQDVIVEFENMLLRRAKKEPIAYIIQKKEFWGLDFKVTCDTLIPRPDSETIVETVIDKAQSIALMRNEDISSVSLKIADIGTGTACLIISLIKELPSSVAVGVDISELALEVARINAKNHYIETKIKFIKSNWLESLEGKFDIIISNPPYIAPSELDNLMEDVKNYEPHLALISSNDGMDSYRCIVNDLRSKLEIGGYAVFEVGKGQADKLAKMLEEKGFVIDEIRNDLAGIARCVVAKNNIIINQENL
ncbi:MAG: peptide chain release factor N(5)-glutamine methyltransferase [Pseudomonadota bacterium]